MAAARGFLHPVHGTRKGPDGSALCLSLDVSRGRKTRPRHVGPRRRLRALDLGPVTYQDSLPGIGRTREACQGFPRPWPRQVPWGL